jgi:hypothetical protein
VIKYQVNDRIVSANLKSPKADGIAKPEIAVYNGHIIKERKTPLF